MYFLWNAFFGPASVTFFWRSPTNYDGFATGIPEFAFLDYLNTLRSRIPIGRVTSDRAVINHSQNFSEKGEQGPGRRKRAPIPEPGHSPGTGPPLLPLPSSSPSMCINECGGWTGDPRSVPRTCLSQGPVFTCGTARSVKFPESNRDRLPLSSSACGGIYVAARPIIGSKTTRANFQSLSTPGNKIPLENWSDDRRKVAFYLRMCDCIAFLSWPAGTHLREPR